MLFNSLHFLFFLPVVFCLYYLIPHRFRWMLVFVASCYFYMSFVPQYILILFLIILIDYVTGLTLDNVEDVFLRKFYVAFSIVANVLLLAFYKYFAFINENIQSVFNWFGHHYEPYQLDIILPIGLSFHTFQSMAYTIEVYRKHQKAERHLGYFANYVLFFPQMVAGPIEKYQTLGNELKKKVEPLYENFSNGFRLILFGLFIKMTVADNLAPIVNEVYAEPAKYHSLEVFSAMLFFSFQIYADFFGYSTIALGTARLLGINLMDNFKTPYLAISINDFWKRWHISLTSWFREYVYISLGGSRKGNYRWVLNILIIFFISGLWHGASWTFVVWGILHGLFYLLERLVSNVTGFKAKEGFSFINLLLGIKTFVLVSFIWVFFRAETFEQASLVFKALFNNWHLSAQNLSYGLAWLFIAVLILFDVFLYNSRFDRLMERAAMPLRWALYAVLLLCVLGMSGMDNLPFIYFQF